MHADPQVALDDTSAGFLAQLARDSDLRAALERDPVATLASFGIRIDPESVPESVTLPSPGKLNAAGTMQEVLWVPFFPED